MLAKQPFAINIKVTQMSVVAKKTCVFIPSDKHKVGAKTHSLAMKAEHRMRVCIRMEAVYVTE
jgi:hypothetical protein